MPRRNFLSTNQKHYQDLGSSRYQYGISALVTQTSFCEGTSGDLAKRRLFSQARSDDERLACVASISVGLSAGLKHFLCRLMKGVPTLRSEVIVKAMLTKATAVAPTKFGQGKHKERESFFNEAKAESNPPRNIHATRKVKLSTDY